MEEYGIRLEGAVDYLYQKIVEKIGPCSLHIKPLACELCGTVISFRHTIAIRLVNKITYSEMIRLRGDINSTLGNYIAHEMEIDTFIDFEDI